MQWKGPAAQPLPPAFSAAPPAAHPPAASLAQARFRSAAARRPEPGDMSTATSEPGPTPPPPPPDAPTGLTGYLIACIMHIIWYGDDKRVDRFFRLMRFLLCAVCLMMATGAVVLAAGGHITGRVLAALCAVAGISGAGFKSLSARHKTTVGKRPRRRGLPQDKPQEE